MATARRSAAASTRLWSGHQPKRVRLNVGVACVKEQRAMNHESIWKQARADLLVPTGRTEPDLYLWEYSWRIARASEHIAGMPEVARHGPDPAAVVAGALYHAACWAQRCRDRECDRTEILLATLSEGDREQSARMLETAMSGVLSPDSLQRALRVVRSAQDRTTNSIEARIVADACSLQEFGVLSLWPMIRRGMLEGKAVQTILDTWNRKKEYHFWEARLNDSFHFEPVREIARRRLERLERLMADLKEQHHSEDLAKREKPGDRVAPPSPSRRGA